jgi:hypothetical protein
MLNQRAFWISSSALVLVLAVMGSGWVFYQAQEFPGVKKLAISDFSADTTAPLFDVSYMRADLYLNAHKDGYDKYQQYLSLEFDHPDYLGYLDMGMYRNFFAIEIQLRDNHDNPATIQDVEINNDPSCTTPITLPTHAEVAQAAQSANRELIDRFWQSVHETMVMPAVVYPKLLNFGEVFYLISKCSPLKAQIETDRGIVSYSDVQ